MEEEPLEEEPIERIPWAQRVGESVAQLHLGERVRAIGGSLVAGLTIAARGIATILQRTLPEGTLTPQPRGKGTTMVLVGFAAFIPIMVAVLVTSTYMQYSTMARFQALLAGRAERRHAGRHTQRSNGAAGALGVGVYASCGSAPGASRRSRSAPGA